MQKKKFTAKPPPPAEDFLSTVSVIGSTEDYDSMVRGTSRLLSVFNGTQLEWLVGQVWWVVTL